MEIKLRKYLNDSYDPSARPVHYDNETVNVSYELILRQLININEKDENIQLAVWSRMKWNDHNLRWEPKKYGNITKINFRSDDIWVPDITLYNYAQDAVDFGGNMDTMNTRIVIAYTGDALWMAPVILKATCRIKVQDFPFDTQYCHFKFGSWTYDMARLNVSSYPMVTHFYYPSQEWILQHHETIRTEIKYTGACPDENCTVTDTVYPDVTFHLQYKRKSLFYEVNLIFPMFLITALTTITFLLPTASEERITIAVTMLLSVIVFLHIVADMVPYSGDWVPRLKVLFFFCISMMFVIIVSLCVVNRLLHRGVTKKKMEGWMRKYVYKKLAFYVKARHRICFCGNPDPDHPFDIIRDRSSTSATVISNRSSTSGSILSNRSHSASIISNSSSTISNHNETDGMRKISKLMENEMSELKEIRKLNEELCHRSCEEEWITVAKTFDHCLFIIYSTIFIIGWIVCLHYKLTLGNN